MNSDKTAKRIAFDAAFAALPLERQREVLDTLNALIRRFEAERTEQAEQDRIDATARELLADIDL